MVVVNAVTQCMEMWPGGAVTVLFDDAEEARDWFEAVCNEQGIAVPKHTIEEVRIVETGVDTMTFDLAAAREERRKRIRLYQLNHWKPDQCREMAERALTAALDEVERLQGERDDLQTLFDTFQSAANDRLEGAYAEVRRLRAAEALRDDAGTEVGG